MLMETSADEQTSIKLPDRISAYRRKFEALKSALDTPGGSLRSRSLDMRIAKNKSDRMSQPLSAIIMWPTDAWFPAKIAALGT